MMLLNDCLPNGKALSLSHVSSNINVVSETESAQRVAKAMAEI